MSDRAELIFKFIFLFAGLVLFTMLVYGGTQREPVEDVPTPKETPSQTPTPKG